METKESPFLPTEKALPKMRCATFPNGACFLQTSGWQERCMIDAQNLALAWINKNTGISLHTIETTLANNHAIVTVWYESPFSSGGVSPKSDDTQKITWD